MARKTKRYLWQKGDFEVSGNISLPPALELIVKKSPEGEQEKAQYFQDLLSGGKVTADDIAFLLESGALSS